jgi:RNase H-fold protein (predicted Holliday junction resolvase)
MDERLSSHAATCTGEVANRGVDATAARIILQDWLDTRR